MPLLISLEGGLAAGKSTVFSSLREAMGHLPGVVFVEEAVDEWEEAGLLASMYAKSLSASAFQHVALASLSADIARAFMLNGRSCRVVVTERSLATNKIFAAANIKDPAELNAYNFAHGRFSGTVPNNTIRKHVYMKLDPAESLRRIARRGRRGEERATREYVQMLHDGHEEWALRDRANVTAVDASAEEGVVLEAVWSALSTIMEAAFVTNTSCYASLHRSVKRFYREAQRKNILTRDMPALFGNRYDDRVICCALMNPALQLPHHPRKIFGMIKSLNLPPNYLFSAFKQAGGITNCSAEGDAPDESVQMAALGELWQMIESSVQSRQS